MNRIFTLLTIIVSCCIYWRCEARQTGDTNELKVMVNTSQPNVRVGEIFKVSLRVENRAPTNQYFLVWGGGWSNHWKADNTNIILFGQACAKNTLGPVEIKPGGAYINEGEMEILHPVPGGRLLFRMGFTPFIGTNLVQNRFVLGKTLWSKEVVIGVVP